MYLNFLEEKMLAGEQGEAVAFAMRILIKLGDLYEAERFIPISGAHIDGCCYQTAGDAGLDFAEKLAGMSAQVIVPTTTNVSGRDIRRWIDFRQPKWLAEKSEAMERAYTSIGAIPTWTCAPYLTGISPGFGEQVVWAESNAIAYGNSAVGLRTHRYGDFVDACAAITGRTPEFGLHLVENRLGDLLFRLSGFSIESLRDTATYALLGYYLGRESQGSIPVIDGIPAPVSPDCLKALSAAGAASGSLALFHIPGVTPEVSTVEQAFGRKMIPDARIIRPKDLEAIRMEISTSKDEKVDLVCLGCPHFSFQEAMLFLDALNGRRISEHVECFIFTNRNIQEALDQTGITGALKELGVRIATDTCILHWILDDWNFSVMATNSGKFAHYAPSTIGMDTLFGSLKDCANAAVTGKMPL